MTKRYLIESPSPFASKGELVALLTELSRLDQSSMDVRTAIAEAKERIESAAE